VNPGSQGRDRAVTNEETHMTFTGVFVGIDVAKNDLVVAWERSRALQSVRICCSNLGVSASERPL
jgi:hypothetical protein